MDKGIYTAVASINSQRMKETNSVHELANVSTYGFKKAYQMASKVGEWTAMATRRVI
jgi:flagellar basal body rod protein FlgG